MKPQTYEDLEARILDLRRQLSTCHDEHKAGDALVRSTKEIKALAREFASAYHKHPWASTIVYEAGQRLIAAVRGSELTTTQTQITRSRA